MSDTIEHNWKNNAIQLALNTDLSWREIAQVLDVPKSTVSDFLRKAVDTNDTELVMQKALKQAQAQLSSYKKLENNISTETQEGKTHLFIADTQVSPGLNLDYLEWIGQYIARKQPDVILHVGDHADMPSLSSYDKGKRTAEGKRVQDDIEAAIEGMERLLTPMWQLQAEQEKQGKEIYKPKMVLTLGNHEDRITRHVNANPELHGFLSIDDLRYEEFGWEVIPFLKPIVIDGISYCHYFQNVMTGKPLGGTAANMIKTIGTSFTQGHRQTLDVTTRFLQTTGQQQWGIIAGAAYIHEEEYKGSQGNHHWKGIIVKHNVKNGSYDPLFVSMDWLKQEYGQ